MYKKDSVQNGTKFGKLIIIKELDRLRLPSGQTNRVFLCKCECGTEKSVRYVHLKNNRTKSCGCSLHEYSCKKDPTIIYIRKIWRAIKYRTSPNYFESHLYYQKGVRVDKEWLENFDAFLDWGIKNNLKKGMQIDRIDGNGNYSKDNCRIVTPLVNSNNRENTYFIFYKGKRYAFTDLIREKKLTNNEASVRARIKRGWSCEKAFDTSIRQGNYRRVKTNNRNI